MSYEYMSITVSKDSHFHEIRINDATELVSYENPFSQGIYTHVGGLDTLFDLLYEADWDIVSAVVHYNGYWAEDLVSIGSLDFDDVIYIHTEFLNNPDEINSMIAYMSVEGVGRLEDWEDSIKINSDTKGGLALEWHDIFGDRGLESGGTIEIPDYLNVDWEATADDIAAYNANTICYFNGEWYMFGN